MIKYVPYVGDSKRALDEYTSEIALGGTNTIVIHNVCEVRKPCLLRVPNRSQMPGTVDYSKPSPWCGL